MVASLQFTSKQRLDKVRKQLKKAGRKYVVDIFHDDVCKISYILWYERK